MVMCSLCDYINLMNIYNSIMTDMEQTVDMAQTENLEQTKNLINTDDIRISIVTVTQLKRHKTIKMLKDMLEGQTFVKYIIEWIIVDGSPCETDAKCNEKHIQDLIESTHLKIIYLPYVEGDKLGRHRNRSNDATSGNYIVCMDDDDYYYPDRVEHAVTELMKSDKLIAGCTNAHIYDYLLRKQFNLGDFGSMQSSNNCMAYKREYLADHRCDDNVTFGEEHIFTNKFNEPMVQLNPDKTTIMSSHQINTFNKREILISGAINIHPTVKETPTTLPPEILEKYKKLFVNNKECEYDIVYACGFFGIPWTPLNECLGGSEQAVVKLSEYWASKGYKVAVYGCVPYLNHNNVQYYPMGLFPYDQTFKNLIVWRENALFTVVPFLLGAKNLIFDLHDNVALSQNIHIHKQFIAKFNKVMFKSEMHREIYEKTVDVGFTRLQYEIVMNGIRIEQFKNNKILNNGQNIIRNPYRFCYCSCYTRGIAEIIAYIWPQIYAAEPRAELHVYYGMEHIKEQSAVDTLKKLFAMPGVMEHGRMSMDMIIREKHMSSYQLYVTNSPLEIDCISVRESLVAGCIPLLSNEGLYKDRDGIHYDCDFKNVETLQNVGKQIVELMKKSHGYNANIRNELKKSPTIISWEFVAEKWLKIMI